MKVTLSGLVRLSYKMEGITVRKRPLLFHTQILDGMGLYKFPGDGSSSPLLDVRYFPVWLFTVCSQKGTQRKTLPYFCRDLNM